LARRLGITPMDAELVLQKCKGSVSGLFASLERYLQVSILDAEVNSLFMQINSAMRHAEAGSSLALPRGSNQS